MVDNLVLDTVNIIDVCILSEIGKLHKQKKL